MTEYKPGDRVKTYMGNGEVVAIESRIPISINGNILFFRPSELTPADPVPDAKATFRTQIELWFMRDIDDEARRKLIALCLGEGVAKEATFENWQRKCLRLILSANPPQPLTVERVTNVMMDRGIYLTHHQFAVLHAALTEQQP